MESIDKTLETMGLAYLDMMIIHSPPALGGGEPVGGPLL